MLIDPVEGLLTRCDKMAYNSYIYFFDGVLILGEGSVSKWNVYKNIFSTFYLAT
jgi:hypothetical protein